MYCKYIIEKYEDMQGTEIPGLKTPGLDPWLDWSSGISFPGLQNTLSIPDALGFSPRTEISTQNSGFQNPNLIVENPGIIDPEHTPRLGLRSGSFIPGILTL